MPSSSRMLLPARPPSSKRGTRQTRGSPGKARWRTIPILSHSERVDTWGRGGMTGRVLRPQAPGGPAPLYATPYRAAPTGTCSRDAAHLSQRSAFSWRRATAQSAICNRRSSLGAASGARTTGTRVSACASEAMVSGARSRTQGPARPPQVQQRNGGGKRVRRHLRRTACSGRGRARQDAGRDEFAGLIEPQRLQRQPPLKGAPIG